MWSCRFDLACYRDLDPCIDHLRSALTDTDYGLPLNARMLHDPARLELRALDGGPCSLLLLFSRCSPGRFWAKDPARAEAVRAHAERVASQPPLFPHRAPTSHRYPQPAWTVTAAAAREPA